MIITIGFPQLSMCTFSQEAHVKAVDKAAKGQRGLAG